MTNVHTNDADLLKRLKAGEEPALAEIHAYYWKPLFSSAFRVLQDRAAAQDVVQEVFISLWEKRATSDIQSLPAYLFGAVHFQVLNSIRHQKTDQRLLKRLKAASVSILASQPYLFIELKEIYTRVLASLPEDQRRYFRLNRDHGRTYQQIAEDNKISVKTVEKKISQTLKSIRLGFDNAYLLGLTLSAHLGLLL